MSEFFYMGGYAFYVWTAYAIAFVVLALNVILPLRLQRKLLRDNTRRLARLRRRDNRDAA